MLGGVVENVPVKGASSLVDSVGGKKREKQKKNMQSSSLFFI